MQDFREFTVSDVGISADSVDDFFFVLIEELLIHRPAMENTHK